MLKVGERLDMETMRRTLENAGYLCVNTVYEHGEFAVRGALMDIFPMGSPHPYRIDLFDDEVETLRTFDPETQLTLTQVDAIQRSEERRVGKECRTGARRHDETYKGTSNTNAHRTK